MKKNLIIAGSVLAALLLIFLVAFFILKIPQRSGLASIVSDISDKIAAENSSEATPEGLQDWVPFQVDEAYGSSPLSGFNFEQKEVKPASVRTASANLSGTDKRLEIIKEKVPDFPYAEVPLLKPAMVISATQEPFNEDISMGMMFYTEAAFDETLEFYRNTLKQYEGYTEEKYTADPGANASDQVGENCTISVVVPGKFKTNVYVMIMEMPETTGYTCAMNISARKFGALKAENVEVQNRADGLPGNYPDKLLPVFKLKDIYDAQGDSKSCSLQYDSDGSYKDAVDFFRNKMNDKTDFSENTETEGETYFYCLVPGWQFNVRVMDNSGMAYIEAECYIK